MSFGWAPVEIQPDMTNLDPRPVDARTRRVLMVAFQFPPFAMSSGVQRMLRFVQHLPSHGWSPIVLTAHPRAYDAVSSDLLRQVPADTVVERAFALDAARHLSIAGRFPGFLARPDRWRSWALGAVPAGLRLIKRHRPDVIWTTYPIATALQVALRLHRETGIPLVADFRDPMVQDGYPADPKTWRMFSSIERDVGREATKLVFVTPSALATYRQRYAAPGDDRFVMIENGFDEESFVAAEQGLDAAPLNPGCLTLLHSGVVYPSERDPTALFEALGRMRRAGQIDARRLRLRFRAPVHVDLLNRLAQQTETTDLVEILAAVPYAQALAEMLRADGLLVMQGSNCNEQIPAKLYEYLRARRPILGLTDPHGDTATTLRHSGVAHLAKLEDSTQVEAALARYLADVTAGTVHASPRADLAALSRQARTRELAELFESVSHSHGASRRKDH
jgi:glycosyltransferase involved in cell wall biosynthesis